MIKKLCLICALVLVGCVKSAEPKPSFLFVILSNHGEIKKEADGSFKLILDHGEVEKVLVFSDRPYRIVKHIKGEQFKDFWIGKGKDSFKSDPPNASIIINQHVQTVVLTELKIVGTKTIFALRPDGDKPLYEIDGKAQLFIDDSCWTQADGVECCYGYNQPEQCSG